jgi:hypothetical protein
VQLDSYALDNNRLPCALNRSILSFSHSQLNCDAKVSADLKQLNVTSVYVKPHNNNLAIKLAFNFS